MSYNIVYILYIYMFYVGISEKKVLMLFNKFNILFICYKLYKDRFCLIYELFYFEILKYVFK